MDKVRGYLDTTSRFLVFVPLMWILLGLSIRLIFFISTGRWPEGANYFNPVEFPEFLRPALDLLILMAVYSFLFLPAILVLMTINHLALRRDTRRFLTIWLPLYSGSIIIAFLMLRFFGKSFEHFI
jgi:hypothetical protein